MSNLALTDAQIFMGPYNLTGYANQVQLTYNAEMLDVSTFGVGTRKNKAGLLVVEATVHGFNDFEAIVDGGIDDPLYNRITATAVPMSLAPVGTENEVAYTFKNVNGVYTPVGGSVGDMLEFDIDAKAQGSNLVRGVIGGLGAKSSTGQGTGYQLGAVSATQKIYAALHVVAYSGTTPTLDVTIESDDNGSFTTPTTQLTFTQVAGAISSEWKEAAGVITDDYWRAVWTLGGTTPNYTVFIVMGIK